LDEGTACQALDDGPIVAASTLAAADKLCRLLDTGPDRGSSPAIAAAAAAAAAAVLLAPAPRDGPSESSDSGEPGSADDEEGRTVNPDPPGTVARRGVWERATPA